MIQGSERQYIQKGETILLQRRSDPTQRVRFAVTAVLGEGGSSVCYGAEAGDRQGRLKELYPMESGLRIRVCRDPDNQLLSTPESAEQFAAMCSDYIRAYDILAQVKAQNESNRILNNYIPPCEIFLGEAKDGTPGSVYVWTPEDKEGKNFEEYMRQLRRNPRKLPEHKLYNILNTLVTLTDCIRLLHSAGLLYLDIKPSNFLVPYDGEMNINTSQISLFDVNSLSTVDSAFPRTSGTPGFRAPEVVKGSAENRSDIYSIGAMLFYAVVVCRELAEPTYREEYYNRLEQLVERSELICASATNSSPSVKYLLTKILQKCLAKRPRQRYGCCEELIADLKTARTYLLPDVYGAYLGLDKRLAILDQSDGCRRDPVAVMQDLLYRRPLFEGLKDGQRDIRVLVVGAGTYGQNFMDVCLQAGQMIGHQLHIRAVSKDAELNRKVYLHYRPALAEFVNINGSLLGSRKGKYADLDFAECPSPFEKDAPVHNGIVAAQIMDGHSWHYIFVSLGDDALNCQVAKAFSQQGADCPVCFVVQADGRREAFGRGAVYVNDPLDAGAVAPELERQAFNVHLSWSNVKKLDMQEARKQFRDPYNYNSSLACALSIPYKLRSVGILETDPDRAAELFREKLLSTTEVAQDAFRQMVALEHRRWVMEKVTAGWQMPRDGEGNADYHGCVRRGRVMDRAEKLHPCIVRSSPETPLKDPSYSWDIPDLRDGKLDELDRMSVELHRCLSAHAEALRESRILSSDDVTVLGRLCAEGDEETRRTFQRYRLCLQNILEGSRNDAGRYLEFEDGLACALKQEFSERSREVSERLARLRYRFFPAVESNLYRDYKANDEAMIRNLPFILTNRPQPYLAMAFCRGNTLDAALNNVASAMVLHPAKITYLYSFGPGEDVDGFLRQAGTVAQWLRRRRVCRAAAFDVAVHSGTPEETVLRLRSGFGQLGVKGTVYVCRDAADAARKLLKRLCSRRVDLYDGGSHLLEVPEQEEAFRAVLTEKIPYFEFDRSSRAFTVCRGCEYLRSISEGACLGAEDVLELTGMAEIAAGPEFGADYQALWKIRKDGVRQWNQLCVQLADYAKKHDVLVRAELDAQKQSRERHLMFYFPSYGYHSIRQLLEELAALELVSAKSAVISHASDTCRMDVYSPYDDLAPVFETLLSSPQIAHPLTVQAQKEGSVTAVEIRCDDLTVTGLTLAHEADFAVLEKLCRAHFITGLRRSALSPEQVRFAYTSGRMKQMLTDPAQILRMYVYYELDRSGLFDDSFWSREQDVCVLIRGFRTVAVRCVAEDGLCKSDYEAMDALGSWWAARKILIFSGQPDTAAQQAIGYGRQLGIETVYEPEKIENISNTLCKIMQSTYREE